jgi:hypothetical protein
MRFAASAFWTILFGLAYTQAPLYYSNQNQYFLHGISQAGVGGLERDWLSNTADPTPVFRRLLVSSHKSHHRSSTRSTSF